MAVASKLEISPLVGNQLWGRSLLGLICVSLISGCFRMPETPSSKAVTPFPWSNETYVDLVQTALSALPGVHMSPARDALKKQEDQSFLSQRLGDICRFEMNENFDGLRQEALGGEGCPVRIEVDNFDQNVDMENGIVRFRENVMYVRERTAAREREGLEIHSHFAFHLEFADGQATPRKLEVSAIAKHLRAGLLKLKGEMVFGAGGEDRVLKITISNEQHRSELEFHLSKNELRIDGGKSALMNDSRVKIYTEAPDLTSIE